MLNLSFKILTIFTVLTFSNQLKYEYKYDIYNIYVPTQSSNLSFR